jgi:signal transduction histidine kinase/CheY-like chemotaxis protein
MFGRLWDSVTRLRSSVVLRLFATVFLFSCAVTLMLTALQLYRDYHRGMQRIETRLAGIGRSYRGSLGEALWRLDQPQLQLEVDGILRHLDIRAAEVREDVSNGTPMVVTAGRRATEAVIAREFPIVYRVHGVEQKIGTLYVEATLTNLYRDLTKTALLILVSQGANTFLVSLFTIYIFSRLVTRYLASFARAVGSYDFRQPPQPFHLHRRPCKTPDELDRLVAAFNLMSARLERAYRDERDAAAEREARRAAEAANRAKGEFLANMSHELRTPLNGILGYAQILRRDKTLGERQREGLGVIQASGEHLLTLINDILDFARIEAGKLRLDIVDVPLADLLRGIAEMISVKAEQKHLEFVCETVPDMPWGVRADERRLRQVLLNLLANAVKFTDHGRVSLRVAPAPFSRVRFDIADTGVGIGEDQQDIIFHPFEQVGEPGRRAGGAGLGLAISRQFVQSMGGDIRVESRVGEGSTFWFELGVAQAPSGAAQVPSTRIVTGYAGARRKVLVIDDVAINRAVALDMLRQVGFETSEAASGLEGLRKAEAEPPSLVLTDIVMPGLDGLETTRRLRRLPGLAELPIIAVSASPSGSDRKRSLEAGANAFLPKPIDLDKLLAQIAALMNLEWIYESGARAGPPGLPAPPGDPSCAVPPHEMENLHRLARLGDMREITQWAERIAALDARYGAFAAQLCELAKRYQSKAILQFVEQHLERRQAP